MNAQNGSDFGEKIKRMGYEQWRKVFVLLCCAMAVLFFMPTYDVAVSNSSELSLSLPVSTMNVISFGEALAGAMSYYLGPAASYLTSSSIADSVAAGVGALRSVGFLYLLLVLPVAGALLAHKWEKNDLFKVAIVPVAILGLLFLGLSSGIRALMAALGTGNVDIRLNLLGYAYVIALVAAIAAYVRAVMLARPAVPVPATPVAPGAPATPVAPTTAPTSATAPVTPAAETPAFCGECGSPIKPGSAFCPGCGRKLS